jgi:lysophospholipase L1-like esterase
VRRLTGARRMIVFTLNRPSARRFNRAVRAFASSARDVALIDWHATARRERLLSRDGVHAAARGYRRRAALIARRL